MNSKAKRFLEALITMTGIVLVVLMTANLRHAAWAAIRNFLTITLPNHAPGEAALQAVPEIRDGERSATQLAPSASAGE